MCCTSFDIQVGVKRMCARAGGGVEGATAVYLLFPEESQGGALGFVLL